MELKNCPNCGKDKRKKSFAKKVCVNCYEKLYKPTKSLDYYYKNKEKINKKRNERLRIKKNIPIDCILKNKNGIGNLTDHGYIRFYKPHHPNSNKCGVVYGHVLVITEHLGRPLRKEESVHHKNGIRNDNNIENLELWHKGQPAGQRVSDKIEWCKNFLEQYGYKITN